MNVQVFHLLSQSFLFLVLLLYYRIDNAEGRVFLGYQPPPQPPLLSSNVVQRSEDPDVYGPKIRSLHQTRSHFHPPAPQPEFETTKKLPFKKKFLIHVLLSMQNEQNNHSDHKILNMLHEKFREHAGPFIPHFLHREIRRDTLKFWGEKTKRENFKTTAGNPPIVRLDAVFGANDPQVDLSLEKAIEMEIDEALSNVLLSLDKDPQSPKMDVSLRKQLEESLIDEISKNLSETLEESEPAGITSEDLSKAIEEGFDELEKEKNVSLTTSVVLQPSQTTPPVSPTNANSTAKKTNLSTNVSATTTTMATTTLPRPANSSPPRITIATASQTTHTTSPRPTLPLATIPSTIRTSFSHVSNFSTVRTDTTTKATTTKATTTKATTTKANTTKATTTKATTAKTVSTQKPILYTMKKSSKSSSSFSHPPSSTASIAFTKDNSRSPFFETTSRKPKTAVTFWSSFSSQSHTSKLPTRRISKTTTLGHTASTYNIRSSTTTRKAKIFTQQRPDSSSISTSTFSTFKNTESATSSGRSKMTQKLYPSLFHSSTSSTSRHQHFETPPRTSISSKRPDTTQKPSPGFIHSSTFYTSSGSSTKDVTSTIASVKEVPQTTSTRRAESSTSSAQIFETDSTLATSAPKRICTTQNDEKLNIQADVLLFIDSTSFLTRLEFAEAIEVFYDSLKNLRNVGSKGIQVSLIQLRHGEPYLEFSFQRHQCLDWLLEDIKDTTFLPSLSGKGGELEKIAQFAFTKSRGDRENAKNLMIVITAGQPDPSFLNDAKKLKENEIELVILATQKADPNQLITLTSFTSNIFVLRQRNNGDTSAKIARLIFEEASHKVNPSKGPTKSKPPGIQPPEIHTRVPSTTLESRGTTTTPLVSAITTVPAAISTPYFGYTAIERAQIKDENETLVLPSTISRETEPSDSVSQQPSEYADANILSTVNPLDQPNILQLQCLPHAFRLHFDLPLKFEGSVFIKGHENDNRCRQDILSAQPRPIEMYIDHDICGATRTHSKWERNSSIILNVQHNISFITLEDRAFILQCSLNMKKAQSQTISADLMVITNEITIGQTISLQAVPPTCNYSIHKSNPGGELIKKAKLGDSVFHTWKCDAIKEINDDYGMLIHDCYVGSEYNNQIPLLDAEGCSTDGELISEIVYDQENLMAYGETKAFAFENGSSLQFTCSVTLCSKEENGCNGVTPPSCAKEVHPNEYSALHATRRDTEAIKPALTMKLQTKVGVTSSASLTLKDRISQIAWSPVAWLLGSFMI